MTRLRVRGLSASYGAHRVLQDVDLPDLADGEMLGLLGPNASGKSTLMRCLTREKPGAGLIELDGRPADKAAAAEWRAKVASMPQSPPAPSALMPMELVWSTARALDLPLSDTELAARIASVFDAIGLSSVALAPLHTLSGGKRQLVGLALALIRDPALLLLDEPTSALDLRWRLVVFDLVRARLERQGGMAIAALHDIDLAARYCDRLALLGNGRIVAAGTPAQVLTPDNLAAVFQVAAAVTTRPDGSIAIQILHPLSGHG